jgi:hypothetical protein
MSELIVIGICGLARSGKDTVAQHLVSHHGFFRIALADGMRSALRDLDGPTWEISKAVDEGPRRALQVLGTECRQDVPATSHWIDHVLIKIRYLSRYYPGPPRFRFAIPDIRFPYEAAGIGATVRGWGGQFQCWKIVRPGAGLVGTAAKHSSETAIDNVAADIMIANGRDLAFLRHNVDLFAGRPGAHHEPTSTPA